MAEIGKRISEIRKKLWMTQQQLSKEAEVDYNTLRKVETGGVKKPSAVFLQKISTALGEDIAALMEDEKPKVQGAHALPFQQLSAERFEELIANILLSDKENYTKTQLYRGRGDKQRDVIAKRLSNGVESTKYTLFQAKRHANVTRTTLKEELLWIKKHFFDDPNPVTPVDDIYFCISTNVSAELQDDIKAYAKGLKLPEPIIWHAGMLNALCEQNKWIIARYFGGDITEAIDLLKEQKEVIKEKTEMLSEQVQELWEGQKDILTSLTWEIRSMGLSQLSMSDDQDMEKARRLIKTGEYEKARDILISMKKTIGITGDKEKKKKLLNNLWICCVNSDKIQEGIECFIEALDIDPTFPNPKQNLIWAYINYPRHANHKLALGYAKELYENEKENLEYLGMYLYTLCVLGDYDSLKKIFESEDVIAKSAKNEITAISVGLFYLGIQDFVSAQKHITASIELFPTSANLYEMLGEVTMFLAEQEGCEIKHLQTIAIYKRPDLLDMAHSHFSKALSLLPDKHPLREKTEFNILVCETLLKKLWIYKDSSKYVDVNHLSDTSKKQLEKINFAHLLEEERKYEEAYTLFKKAYEDLNPPLSFEEIENVAIKFFHYWSPEHTLKLLSWIEDQAKTKKSIHYWSYKSMSHALLEEKNDVISTLTEAQETLKDDPEKLPIILAHYATLAIRYPDHSESDRMIERMQKLDQLQPEKWIIKAIPAVNVEDGSLTTEIKEMFSKLRADMEEKKHMFMNTPLPIYTLEKLFSKSFPEVMEMVRGFLEPDFVLPYNALDAKFQENRKELFDNNDSFIVDYSTLLNLARCGSLWIFKSLWKKVMVSQLLLFQVQEDLVKNEDEAVRDVWNFLRKWVLTIIPDQLSITNKLEIIPQEIEEFFPEWLVQEIEYSVREDVVLITDDLRLAGYINGDEIKWKATNSFILFQKSFEQKKIDKKQYSLILAQYAESRYHFIPFDGEDLLNIVLDDENAMRHNTCNWVQINKYWEMKISRRVLQLLNQAHLPGSIVWTFVDVCGDFLTRLFKLWVLDETKLDWVLFLTNFFSEFLSVEEFQKVPFGLQDEKIEQIIWFIVRMWGVAVRTFGKDMHDKIVEKSKDIKHDILKQKIQELLKKLS